MVAFLSAWSLAANKRARMTVPCLPMGLRLSRSYIMAMERPGKAQSQTAQPTMIVPPTVGDRGIATICMRLSRPLMHPEAQRSSTNDYFRPEIQKQVLEIGPRNAGNGGI